MPATSDPNMLRSWDLHQRVALMRTLPSLKLRSFLTSFYVYRNQAHAELKANDTISFTVGRGSRQASQRFSERASASARKDKAIPAHQVEPTEAILKRTAGFLRSWVTGPYSFSYEHSYELARRT